MVPTAFAADVIAPLGKEPQPAPVADPAQLHYSAGIEDVLKMLDAKVDPEVVKAYIKSSPIAYNPSADEIVALKQRDVPDDVITTILERGAEVRAQFSAQAPAPTYAQPPTVSTPTPTPYAPGAVPDYMYDYGYPGYPSASYWYGYPYWGYPWYGGWGWYNWWWPGFSFYVPFYYGCYYHGHYPYHCGYYNHYAHYHDGGIYHGTPYGSHGTWAHGQTPSGTGAGPTPYSGMRNGSVQRLSPSAPSASPARTVGTVGTRTGSSAPAQPVTGTAPARPGPYSTPGGYRGNSGVIRGYGYGGMTTPAFTRSSPYASAGYSRSSPYAMGGYSRSAGSMGAFRGSAPSAGGMRGGGFGGGGMRGGGFGGGGMRGGGFGGGGGFHGGGGFGGGHGGGGGHR